MMTSNDDTWSHNGDTDTCISNYDKLSPPAILPTCEIGVISWCKIPI